MMKQFGLIVAIFGALMSSGLTAFAQENGEVPMVSPEDACVPAEEIYFDTFDGRAVRFSEASEDTILRLRDAIPPIDAPQYEDASGGDWLGEHDLILGYIAPDGAAYAYPHKIMNFHEIINEDFDGEKVLISYCPLCGSGLVFDRILDGEELTFGNTSALYESDMVMYDHQSGSYWHQVGGLGIVGDFCEQRLELRPSFTMTWGEWRTLHPDTLILSRETGFGRNYERDPFVGYAEILNGGRFAFPVSELALDDRLPAGTTVLGVEVSDQRRVYVPELLGDAVINAELGGENIVIFSQESGSAAAFFAEMEFDLRDGEIIDVETESTWNLAGEAISGDMAGALLEPAPTRTTFWFSLVATYPDIEVFSGE